MPAGRPTPDLDANEPTLDPEQGSTRDSLGLLAYIQDLSRQESYQAVLNCTAKWLPRILPADRASLTFPVPLKGQWTIGPSKELQVTLLDGDAAIPSDWRVPIEGSILGEAFTSGKMRGSGDLSKETHSDLAKLAEAGLRSTLCAPLIAGGNVIGTLNLARYGLDAFTEEDERTLMEAANVVAAQCLLHQRIDEAKEATKREAENSRIVSLLQRMQLKLAHQHDEGQLCRTTAHSLKRIFRTDQASIALLNGDRDIVTIRALVSAKNDDPFDLMVPLEGSAFERTILTKRSFTWKNDVAPETESIPELAFIGLRSGITAPLSSGTDVIGTVNLASADPDAFDPQTVARITEFGRIVGTAIASLRANQVLRDAQEHAESASAAKGAFLANVSHELRTPLNGVLGMAQLLEGTQLDEEQLELVSTIKSSGQLLMRVIRDVLEVSKIESGSTMLEELEFDPVNTIEKACAMVSPAAKEKGLVLEIQTAPEVPRSAIGDPTRLQQIVVNLLSNAVKFTSKGGVYVTLDLVESGGADHPLKIAVRDTGKGISGDAIERIFVPFQQEEASTTRRFGGTGLGLAICRQFAELMGGNVSATSQEGEGSTFTVEVKLGLSTSPTEVAGPTKATDDLPADFAESAPLRILVVDDNPVNRRVAQRLLQRLGYDPALAKSGQEAIDLAKTTEFDLILMDLSMPEVDGFEATEAILKEVPAPPIIVALTADVQEATGQRCLDVGMLGLLAKPFSVGALKVQLSTVHGALTATRAAA